jgi:hypothetical protein
VSTRIIPRMTVGVWTIISPSGVRQDAGTEQISGHLVIQMTASGQLVREFHDQEREILGENPPRGAGELKVVEGPMGVGP